MTKREQQWQDNYNLLKVTMFATANAIKAV